MTVDSAKLSQDRVRDEEARRSAPALSTFTSKLSNIRHGVRDLEKQRGTDLGGLDQIDLEVRLLLLQLCEQCLEVFSRP